MFNKLKKYAMEKVTNELEEAPVDYIKNVFKSALYTIGLLPLILAFLLLVVLFLFAFTNAFTAPSVTAQVLFFILLVCTAVYFRILRALVRLGSKIAQGTVGTIYKQITKKAKVVTRKVREVKDKKGE
jgi:hypothetical protein